MMSAAGTIKRIRLSLCLEQQEFAALIGVNKGSISNYENGIRFPRLPTVRKIIDVAKKNKIKVNVEDFLPKSPKETED